MGVQGNVSNLADLDRLYATVKEQKGHMDILFANAGVGQRAPLGTITEAQFDEVFDINVKGLLFNVLIQSEYNTIVVSFTSVNI